ncbi:MAG: two-component system response regulator [Planctomycetota bacterium]|nr:MAG: two-component system response regulator [Planctomycetota bacterium]
MSTLVTPRSDWQDLERSAILVVDDEAGIREVVSRCLELDGHRVLQAPDLPTARELLRQHDVLVVLCDLTIGPGQNGLDLLSELAEQRVDLDVLIMTANSDVPSAVEALKRGAYDYLCKPFPLEVLRAAVSRALERRRLRLKARMLEVLENRRLADEENLEQFLVSMANVIDAKSRFTAKHSLRVSELARLFGEALGYDPGRCELVALGGRLHDIGKLGTPDAILDKPGPLTREEFAIMQLHPVIGDELLAPIKNLAALRPMVRWHHESLDGQGYPDRLAGHEIPEEAWVVKVADYWEAITAMRPYRDPMPLEKAVSCLRGEAGTHIPRELVETFLTAIQHAPLALPSGRATTPVAPAAAAGPAPIPPSAGSAGATAAS